MCNGLGTNFQQAGERIYASFQRRVLGLESPLSEEGGGLGGGDAAEESQDEKRKRNAYAVLIMQGDSYTPGALVRPPSPSFSP